MRVVVPRAERAAEPRARDRRPVASVIASRAVGDVGAEAVVERAAASGRGSASGGRPGGRPRRSGAPRPGSASAHRPWTKNGRAHAGSDAARRGCARRCRAGTRVDPDAPRRTSARRGRAHSRVVTFAAWTYAPGSRPASDREPPGEQLRGHDRRRRREQAPERADVESAARPASRPSLDRPARAAPSRGELVGEAQVEVARSRARSRPPSPRAPGPASSSGPWRNCAACSDSTGMPTASFSVRAPISAAARAPPAPRITRRRAAAVPGHEVGRPASASASRSLDRRRGRLRVGLRTVRRPRRRARPRSPARTRRSRPAPRRTSSSTARSPRRPGSSRRRSATRASVLSGSFVTATTRRASPRAAQRSATPHRLGALARLADERPARRPRAASAAGSAAARRRRASTRRDARRGERRHGRVARVVGAPHAREDEGAAPGGAAASARGRRAVRPGRPAARRSASGWPAISAMNGSGKFPNDFTGAECTMPAAWV